MIGDADAVPSMDTDGERGLTHENHVALNEVLPRGQVEGGAAPGDHAQIRECLRRDTIAVITRVRPIDGTRRGRGRSNVAIHSRLRQADHAL